MRGDDPSRQCHALTCSCNLAITEEKENWNTLEPLPYNPDLSPCKLHMFGLLKEPLDSKRIETKDGFA